MEKKKLDMKIKIVLGIIIFIVVLFIGSFVYYKQGIKATSSKNKEVIVTIPKGSSGNDIIKILDKNKLIKIYKISKNRQDLFFDAISSSLSEKNKKILIYFKWLKYILENNLIDDENLKFELISLKNELENSIKTWMKEYLNKIKELSWEPKLNALKTALFYSKWDNLNLYSYLFFSKFKNIETVKFPTRWRSYNQKLKLIEETVNNWKVDEALIDRTSSLERSHYDLSYLFWDKLWFRKLINNK